MSHTRLYYHVLPNIHTANLSREKMMLTFVQNVTYDFSNSLCSMEAIHSGDIIWTITVNISIAIII